MNGTVMVTELRAGSRKSVPLVRNFLMTENPTWAAPWRTVV
jgi:hypothetical protein